MLVGIYKTRKRWQVIGNSSLSAFLCAHASRYKIMKQECSVRRRRNKISKKLISLLRSCFTCITYILTPTTYSTFVSTSTIAAKMRTESVAKNTT